MNNKSVGIITMHRVQNYGSVLQAYALSYVINRMGFDCKIIDYQYPNKYHTEDNNVRHKANIFKRAAYFILYRNTKQKSRFNLFHDKYLLRTRHYSSQEEIYKDAPQFDIYVTGSDQVWNPFCMKGDPVFFCDFAPIGCYKISYASSFAVSQIPHQHKKLYTQCLLSYSAISIREQSGKDIVKELTGTISQVVCDPTLLLTKDDYKSLVAGSSLKVKGDYILVYALTYAYDPYPQLTHVIKRIKAQLKLPVIYLHSNTVDHYHFKTSITSAGPCEFIDLVMNAKFVITSSFHGTAFAINFGVPFYSIVPSTSSGDDDRILSLLRTIGLESRAISVSQNIPKNFEIDLDYAEPHTKLQEYRDASLNFLLKSFENY